MKISDPSLSPDQSRAIERASREEPTFPVRLQRVTTANLPPAADTPGAWVYDETTAGPKFSNASAWIGYGTAALKNTGTSGNNVPLLDGTNTWSGAQTINANLIVTTSSSPSITHTGAAGGLIVDLTNGSYTGIGLLVRATRAAGTGTYFLAAFYSNMGGTPDAEVVIQDNGVVKSDGGTAMTTPADIAHMFEWVDGNPDNEDRRGVSVVFQDGKIRPATKDDDPAKIRGVILWDPGLLFGDDFARWAHKYLTDDFNSPIMEDFELVSWVELIEGEPIEHAFAADRIPEGVKVPKKARRTTEQRRKVNPVFDPVLPREPRRKRSEWDPMGHRGRLRLRIGQPVKPSWEKLRDISPTVEEWWVE